MKLHCAFTTLAFLALREGVAGQNQVKLVEEVELDESDGCLYVTFASSSDILSYNRGYESLEVHDWADCSSPVKIDQTGLSNGENYHGYRFCVWLEHWLSEWNRSSELSITVTYTRWSGEEIVDTTMFCPPGGICCGDLGKYSIMDEQYECPDGFERVASLEECQQASHLLGFGVNVSRQHDAADPIGCWTPTSDNPYVYFNTRGRETKGRNGRNIICKALVTTCEFYNGCADPSLNKGADVACTGDSSTCDADTCCNTPEWSQQSNKHCAGDKASNIPYTNLIDAQLACLSNPACYGVYDARCDNSNNFYQCQESSKWKGSSINSCVYVKPDRRRLVPSSSDHLHAPERSVEIVENLEQKLLLVLNENAEENVE